MLTIKTCLTDKSAVGWDHVSRVEKHESQTDYARGFGGKYGVQNVQDKSAVGYDDVNRLSQHDSQKTGQGLSAKDDKMINSEIKAENRQFPLNHCASVSRRWPWIKAKRPTISGDKHNNRARLMIAPSKRKVSAAGFNFKEKSNDKIRTTPRGRTQEESSGLTTTHTDGASDTNITNPTTTTASSTPNSAAAGAR